MACTPDRSAMKTRFHCVRKSIMLLYSLAVVCMSANMHIAVRRMEKKEMFQCLVYKAVRYSCGNTTNHDLQSNLGKTADCEYPVAAATNTSRKVSCSHPCSRALLPEDQIFSRSNECGHSLPCWRPGRLSGGIAASKTTGESASTSHSRWTEYRHRVIL